MKTFILLIAFFIIGTDLYAQNEYLGCIQNNNSNSEKAIIDITGKIIDKRSEQNLTFGNNEIVLDNILQKGEYLFQIQVTNHNGSFRQTKKIIKK